MSENFSPSSLSTSKGVILDIGTGDGRFVYQMARKNPNKLYIGIDSSSQALVKVSEKIERNPKHGGAKNALFLYANVESLPEELTSIADEVHIHFPWGSLLRGVMKPDDAVLQGLRRVLKHHALLEIITAIDAQRDANELHRLGISDCVRANYIEEILLPQFAGAKLLITEHGLISPGEWPTLCTSWAAKLKSGGSREVRYLIAQAQ